MMLFSPAFPPGGAIPPAYTCDGSDLSPPLSWSGVPAGAKSLVLIVEDPDAPSGTFHHWAAYDIPPSFKGLPKGYSEAHLKSPIREAENDFGKIGYGGPCPPPGPAHHYHFRLLALGRASLDLADPASALSVLKAAEPYAIARAELVGTYRRH